MKEYYHCCIAELKQLPDSQIYSFFTDNGPGKEGTFLFKVKLEPQLRPKVGDSLSNPITLENFRIMRDEFTITQIRVTDAGLIRVTDAGLTRITDTGSGDAEQVTHNYFVLPANNPNRISTWTTNTFDDDQTLAQLFR